uniref:AP180 N-terminal homology (ANTH) domain-containing protein n=1 Tax=Panagrolaimus sp. ES5 TaxID=591445 RepID=A0AC34GBF7_9BILA
YEKFPGSFELPVTNISVSSQNVEKAYELAIDLLDQLEALLDVHSKIAAIMTGLHLSSLTLSGQCTYGPSVQIILDTSKIYDITCHLLFNLHSQLPSDVLDGHRTRFYKIFRQLKTVYWEAKGTNFITGQITVPKLPENSPDFLNASCMDNYHAPEANEKQQMEDDSMISAKSMIVDFSEAPTPSHPIPISLENDTKDSQIRQLQYDNSVLRQRQDTIIEEAQSRVRDYENSLQSLHAELTRTKAFAACAPRYEEEVRKLKQQLNEAQYNQRAAEEKAIKKVSSEMDSRLMIANIDIVNFKRKLENTENALLNLKRENTSFSTICISILKLLEEAGDDLHNATSITYPSHLIANALIADMELL